MLTRNSGSSSCAVGNKQPLNAPNNAHTAGDGRQKHQRSLNRGVLLLGQFRELALYRAAYLRDRGFDVTVLIDIARAVDLIKYEHFDAVIFSYTLPSEAVVQLSQLLREVHSSSVVIAISNSIHVDRKVAPDEVVLADDGPEALLAALRRAVGNKTQ